MLKIKLDAHPTEVRDCALLDKPLNKKKILNQNKIFTDQTGRKITLSASPRRIISLVPSQTEFLCDLGLEEETVGITKFCVHPARWFKEKARVGGTKNIKPDKIAALQPDLIIANKEENDREQILQLAEEYNVWLSDIVTLEDAYAMMSAVGKMTDKEEKAAQIVQRLKDDFVRLKNEIVDRPRKKAAYFIWQKPMMAAASGTFIDEMLRLAGFVNVFAEQTRYPEIDVEELRRAAPDVILLSSEPFPFREKHIEKFAQLCPDTDVMLVDGELFSWYGTRLLHSAEYLSKLRKEIDV